MRILDMGIGGDSYSGEVLLDGFGADLSDWWEEGLGRFSLEDGKMIIDAREGGYTAFYKKSLPDNIMVQYATRSLPPFQQNNFNLISHCTPPKPGWPIVEMGRYPGYREFDNYIITFVGDWEREDWGAPELDKGRIRFRRNPGFDLNLELPVESRYGAGYQVAYAVVDGLLRYYINGQKMGEWQDPNPLTGGYFALRTFCTVAEYRDLVIARIL